MYMYLQSISAATTRGKVHVGTVLCTCSKSTNTWGSSTLTVAFEFILTTSLQVSCFWRTYLHYFYCYNGASCGAEKFWKCILIKKGGRNRRPNERIFCMSFFYPLLIMYHPTCTTPKLNVRATLSVLCTLS